MTHPLDMDLQANVTLCALFVKYKVWIDMQSQISRFVGLSIQANAASKSDEVNLYS